MDRKNKLMKVLQLNKMKPYVESNPQGLAFEKICGYLQIEATKNSCIIFESLVKYSQRIEKHYISGFEVIGGLLFKWEYIQMSY